MNKKAKGFLNEFKEFISRGSVMDLAVGMIIGAAFTAIVNALVNNILNPIIGLLVGGIQFSEWKIPLGADSAIDIGAFINAVITFLITAFVIFLIVKALNSLHRKPEPAPDVPVLQKRDRRRRDALPALHLHSDRRCGGKERKIDFLHYIIYKTAVTKRERCTLRSLLLCRSQKKDDAYGTEENGAAG